MKKVILVDGNNLLFRSYYATAYSGNLMKNKEGFPTNGLYGFTNMMNKIIKEEEPKYIMVAFDIGKTFRHDKYDVYKGGRSETPEELKVQFPVAKKLLNAMGIKYLECENYEADDIIGTFAHAVDENDDFVATIVSSDKDLLQLISDDVTVKLLKTKDFIRMDKQMFRDTYGIDPIRMIDLKGLMGDSSDNIPGVKGIGEKTALKLLQEYDSVEGVYDNIEKIKGATRTKLESGKDSAFMSKEIATIVDAPVDTSFESIKYSSGDTDELINLYNDLGFYSFLKKMNSNEVKKEIEIRNINNINELNIKEDVGVYLELDGSNYHNANIVGVGLYNKNISCYLSYDELKQIDLSKASIYTYDSKRLYVSFINHDIKFNKISFDTMIAGYLLNYSIKDDIAYLANLLNYDINFYDKKEILEDVDFKKRCIEKAKFIYDSHDEFMNKMKEAEVLDLYNDIEAPLAIVLAKMELEGISVDKSVLEDMGKYINIKLELISKDIYNYAGCEFNISSPKQLGEILFEKLDLKHGKKTKTGYSTDANILNKLKSEHPIIPLVLEYRLLSKLLSTYIDGLLNIIKDDNRIHTIYTQTLTRTGRLSSIEPNLQNIPIRNEYGKLIRKAFVPLDDSVIMSSDYSQIELRVFAHLADEKKLKEAFINDIDIHTKTAMDIFEVPKDFVTSNMRRQAKAVNFGILYGISSYGLSEDLGISPRDAKEFIEKYFETYPDIKDFMNMTIEDAHKNGYVKTIMNRKRNIEELNNKNYVIRSMGERMALNTPVQGSSADILKKSMIEIDRKFEEDNLESKMLLQVHDELIFNVKNNELDKVKKIVQDIMENSYKLSVPLKVDIEVGHNWYEAK